MKLNPRTKFLLRNGLKGLVWMILLLTVYFLFRDVILSHAPDGWIEKFYERPGLIYLIYCISEFFFGIIPPEIFMIWAINRSDTLYYFINIVLFAGISYLMSYLTFLIGRFFYCNKTYKYLERKFFRSLMPQVKRYGIFLIIVAALTPVPWSAVCLLVGSAGYPSKQYLKYALFRLLRFAAYGYIIFQTHQF